MHAIIQIQGKQYRVEKDQEIVIDRLDSEAQEELKITDVLMIENKDKILVGTPFVKNAIVTLKVIDHSKSDKIRVQKYKSKSRYRKLTGHRQLQTTLVVADISVGK